MIIMTTSPQSGYVHKALDFFQGLPQSRGMFLLFTYTAELAGCHERQLCLFGFHFPA